MVVVVVAVVVLEAVMAFLCHGRRCGKAIMLAAVV